MLSAGFWRSFGDMISPFKLYTHLLFMTTIAVYAVDQIHYYAFLHACIILLTIPRVSIWGGTRSSKRAVPLVPCFTPTGKLGFMDDIGVLWKHLDLIVP
jgi:hypothetical protein